MQLVAGAVVAIAAVLARAGCDLCETQYRSMFGKLYMVDRLSMQVSRAKRKAYLLGRFAAFVSAHILFVAKPLALYLV